MLIYWLPFELETHLKKSFVALDQLYRMEWSLKVVLVAQYTCKAIENFARAPRDEKKNSNRGPGEFVFYAKNCTRVQKISEIEETFVNNWVVR